MGHLRISCREAHRLMSLERDRPLPWPRRAVLWLHLRACSSCRRVLRGLDLLSRAVRELGR